MLFYISKFSYWIYQVEITFNQNMALTSPTGGDEAQQVETGHHAFKSRCLRFLRSNLQLHLADCALLSKCVLCSNTNDIMRLDFSAVVNAYAWC